MNGWMDLFTGAGVVTAIGTKILLGKTSIEKKTFSFGHWPNFGGGGLPMAEFFDPLFRSAFLVNKKSLFPQKCQCIELLTVFRLLICSILYSIYSILSSKLIFKS